MNDPLPANRSQIDFWNGATAQRWVSQQQRLDRAFAPMLHASLERAAPAAGERVVDIGCGCGASLMALAEKVGDAGHVTGLDVSAPMLAVAKERARGLRSIECIEGDAAVHPFDGSADLVYSRFGVMFFGEPEAAFTNLRRALRAGGRLSFMSWRARDENPWHTIPQVAAAPFIGSPPVTPPGAPGPFSLASADRTREILAAAGFMHVDVEPYDVALRFSTTGMPEAVDFAAYAGPSALLLADKDTATVAQARAAFEDALRPYARGDVVALPAAVWLVTARA
jgi:SAM-dependent methyltransferase